MKRIHMCYWCQRPYPQKNESQKYCSEECREEQANQEERYEDMKYAAGYAYAAGYRD